MSEVGLAMLVYGDGRPPALSDEQLEDLERAVDDAVRLRRRSREAKSKTMVEAGALLRSAMPALWLQIEFVRLLKASLGPPRSKVRLGRRREILAAQVVIRKIKALLQDLNGLSPSGFGAIASAQGTAWVDISRMEAVYGLLLKAVESQAILSNRPADVWTSAVATTVALWWLEQGWNPNSHTDGAFVAAVRSVRGFRFQEVDLPEPGHSLILSAIADAKEMHPLGYLDLIREALDAGFRESQLIVPWPTSPKPPK